MSIKPDRWIRKMAKEHGMIEPFVDRQVRKGAISYGVSSYGYDLRVSNEFKVFTDVYGAVVDPKNFDPKSFVDVKTDVCMVPPHSFALARSVEFFRIPRNVLTVCLGKCLTGDTRVIDAETGDYLPISEFAGRRSTIALDGWRVGAHEVAAAVSQGRQPVFELRTRAGLRIKATASHPFRQLRGWTPLSQLRPGDRIAAARHVPVFGSTPLPEWEAALLGLMISEGQCSTPGHSPTFTNEDPALVELFVRCAREGLGCDVTNNGHIGYRIVNRAGRGGSMTTNRATLWLQSHGAATKSADKSVPKCVFTAPAEGVAVFLRALFAGDGSVYQAGDSMFLEYYSMSRRLIEDVHHLLLRFGIMSLIRDKRTHLGSTAFRLQITDRAQIARFAERIGFWPGTAKQFTLEHQIAPAIAAQGRSKSNFDTLPREGWELVRHAVERTDRTLASAGVRATSPDQSMPYSVAAKVAEATGDPELATLVEDGPLWDVVESIVPAGVEETYDLTVPGVHNFLANDLVVHNSTYARCGIIVNVTPFEPEWEGHVTLEISNTTPLPCRIYANEGLAQVLFFESDEACETSYKDRKGKYQGQRGITLPRK